MTSAGETPTPPFTLLRELGRGGMGIVYLATDHQRGDQCAVKLLHDSLTHDQTAVARFQTEARAAVKIKHSAIVQIRGVDCLPDGRWYCMMEYLDGRTLTQFCAERGPLPLALILEIIAPICEAIDQAHAANIIHRDLKPDNVIVVMRDGVHISKLLDFGIAKLTNEPGVTRPGSAPGTVAYMAPEQTRDGTVDRRCDVYSLGVMVYQMITGGQLPYDAKDGELYHRQMTQPPIDPRQRCATVLVAAVGPILAAINVDPSRRPSMAGSLALMLARCIPDGMNILEARAPKLRAAANLEETLRTPSPAPALAPTIVEPRSSTPAPAPWSYEYGQVLGKGGFGEVLRGTKKGTDGFARPVAIKRILPEHAKSPAFVKMFHQEARIASLLRHQNVIDVLDHATDPAGQLIIVMEFIEGINLDKLRRSVPIPYSVALFIICEALEGLGYAHHLQPLSDGSSADEIAARADVRGVVHRDMSHDNVMLSWHGEVKVMDFGIAKMRDKTQAEGSVMLKGKPAYFSPELATAALEIDGRSDLFAVGVMLWELLTGKSLFERETLAQMIHAVLYEKYPKPTAFNPHVPADIELVTMKLLEFYAGHRYQTAQDAITALRACAAWSRDGRTELKQLLQLVPRVVAAPQLEALPSGPPESPDATSGSAPDGRRAFANPTPWQSAPTTHSHAVGESVAGARPLRSGKRALGVAAAVVTLGATAAIGALMMNRRASESTVDADRSASPGANDSVTPFAGTHVPKPASATTGHSAPIAASSPDSSPLSTCVVDTVPSGASVRVQDARGVIATATSPITVQVPQGAQISVHAEFAGFTPVERGFQVARQERQTLTLALVPIVGATSPTRTTVHRSAPRPITEPTKPVRPMTKPTEVDSADEIMK